MANGPTLPPQAYTREILTAAFNWLQTQPDALKKLAVTPDALVGLYMRAQRYGASSMEVDAPVSSQNFMSDLKNLAEGLKQFEEPRRANAGPSAGASAISHAGMSAPLQQGAQVSHHGQLHGQSHGQNPVQNQAPHTGPASVAMPLPGTYHASAGPGAGGQSIPMGAQFLSNTGGGQYGGSPHQATPYPSSAAATGSPPAGFQQQQQHFSSGPTQEPHHVPQNAPNTSHASPGPHGATAPQMSSGMGTGAGSVSAQLSLNERTQQMIHEVKTNLNLSSHAEAINMMVTLAYKQIKPLLS